MVYTEEEPLATTNGRVRIGPRPRPENNLMVQCISWCISWLQVQGCSPWDRSMWGAMARPTVHYVACYVSYPLENPTWEIIPMSHPMTYRMVYPAPWCIPWSICVMGYPVARFTCIYYGINALLVVYPMEFRGFHIKNTPWCISWYIALVLENVGYPINTMRSVVCPMNNCMGQLLPSMVYTMGHPAPRPTGQMGTWCIPWASMVAPHGIPYGDAVEHVSGETPLRVSRGTSRGVTGVPRVINPHGLNCGVVWCALVCTSVWFHSTAYQGI